MDRGLPYELALRVMLESGNYQEEMLDYFQPPTFFERFMQPVALGAMLWILHGLSFMDKL